MSGREKWDHAVQKLITLTNKGELEWHQDLEAQQRGHSDVRPVGAAYCTVVAKRSLRVYEYAYDDDSSSSGDEEETTDVAIEFTNGPEVLWRWPQTLHRWELLETVRGQVAGADEFLEQFLGSESS